MGEVYKEKRIYGGKKRALIIQKLRGKLCIGISHKNVNFNQLQSDKQHEILVLGVLWHIQAELTLVLLHYTGAAVCGQTILCFSSQDQ